MGNAVLASWIDCRGRCRAVGVGLALALTIAAPAIAGPGNASVGTSDPLDAKLFSVVAAAATPRTHYFSVYDGGTQASNFNNEGATGVDSLAAGVGASSIGDSSIAIGAAAVAQNTRDVYIGTDAGIGATASAGNADNLGVGSSAAQNVNGYDNNAIGVRAGSNLIGSYNTGIGTDAGGTLSGVANTALGANTGNNLSGSNNLAAGVASGNFLSGSNNVAMGAFAGSGNSTTPLAISNTVAIGNTAMATADNAIAIGLNATASGNSSIAVGNGNMVSGVSSGAFGDPSVITGNGSYSMGNNNSIAANNVFVLGSGVAVAAGLDGAVALGNGTTVTAAMPTAGVIISGTPYIFAGGSPAAGDVLSVGSAGAPRQIQNVAAGQISATSTDAVNGSELYATNQAVTSANLSIANLVNTLDSNIATLYSDVSGGNKYFQASSSLAEANATGANSIAAGPASNATAVNSVAIGNGATASTANSVALGSGATTAPAAPAAGTTINGTSYTYAGAAPTAVVSVGAPGAERQITNVAAGQVSASSTNAVNGSELYATDQAVTRVADGGAGPVQYSSAAAPTTPNGGVPTQNLTLVGASAGAVSLHNVAAGVAPTDAANVQQLNAATSATLSSAEAYTDSRINGFQNEIDAVQRNGEAGTASAMAMAGVPQSYLPGKTMLAAGVAEYGAQSSLAMGLSTLSDNGRWIIRLNGSANTRGRYGAAVGAGVMW